MHSMSGMGGGGSLNASGVDFSNRTQAMAFLAAMLDDSVFQVDGNTYARSFWYGVVVVIGLAGIANAISRATLHLRQGAPATPSA
jgi:ferric-chelate reductase